MTAGTGQQSGAWARVHAALELGRPDEAARLLSLLLAAEPDNAALWILLSKAHHDAHRYPEALNAAERGLRADPQSSQALYYRALGLWNARVRGQNLRRRAVRGQAQAAQASLREALRLEPFHVGYHVTLASLLLQTRDLAPAEAHLRQALALDPAHTAALLTLAELALQRKNAAEALALAQRVLAQEPDSVAALGILAWAQLRQNEPHAALRTALNGLRMSPADPGAQAYFTALTHAYLPRPMARGSWVWRVAVVPQVGVVLLPLLAAGLGARNVWRYRRLPPDLRGAVARIRPLRREQGALLAMTLSALLLVVAAGTPDRDTAGVLLGLASTLLCGVTLYWLGWQVWKRLRRPRHP
ncbi:tetratricopeptide repeat protein [Deinococcus aquaedulcis]|uniref:tetratricopeptide repeat protein n=1 Tax=Deinococcus aquaedulcis TaxID=2840455 RepID=UPI001C8334AE|nr:tetratricopeptide repeat protein [Deinococcus aquaedulcis]